MRQLASLNSLSEIQPFLSLSKALITREGIMANILQLETQLKVYFLIEHLHVWTNSC